MIVIDNKPIAYFDVDDTLLCWDNNNRTKDSVECEVMFSGRSLTRYYIPEHFNELILQKEAGTTIIVWSASGSAWAEAVVRALGLQNHVDVCMPKPNRIYDDKDPIEWMPKRRYLVK